MAGLIHPTFVQFDKLLDEGFDTNAAANLEILVWLLVEIPA